MWDIHAHVIPPDVIDAAQRAHYGLTLADNTLTLDGKRVLYARLTDLGTLIEYAKEHDVNLVLSLPPALTRGHRGDQSAWFRFINDALSAVCDALPIHAEALAMLPLAQPTLAMKEWERIQSRTLGFTLASEIEGELITASRFATFWDGFAASGGGMAFIHGGPGHDPRLRSYYLDNLVGYPAEDTFAVAALVFSGLPLEHPEIQWGISHGGGSGAFLLGRWQRGYDTKRPGIDVHLPSPSEVFQELWFDSVVHDPRALTFLLEKTPHRVVFGTDYPFPMGTQHEHLEVATSVRIARQIQDNTEHLLSRLMKGRTTA